MARKKRGAVLCSSCRQLISVHEKRCPYCGAVAPSLFGFGPDLHVLFRDHLDLSRVTMGLCIFMYSLSLIIDPGCIDTGIHLGFASPSSPALAALGMTSRATLLAGAWWTLLTATFLHGSLIHIGFNLMWIRALAPTTIREFGAGRFVILYVLSGVGCFLLSDLVNGAPTIGASGAVFGLMGALLAYGKRRGGTFGQALRRDMLYWAGLAFFLGMMMGGVNNTGHAGGFVTGLILGWLMPYKDRKPETRLAQISALLLLGLTVAAFVISFVTIGPLVRMGDCP